MNKERVIVVGGGLAGMACGLALEEAGCQVTLLEARQGLGGRAGSYRDHESGELLDSSQHVLLGCCVNLLDFYKRVGALEKILWEKRVHFLDVPGDNAKTQMAKRYDLWAVPGLGAPLHMGLAFAGFGLLTVRERVALVQAMRAMMRLGKAGRNAWDNRSFKEWLLEHRQPAELTRKFYEPVLISALNIPCEQASAKYAIQVFQDALLANARGYVMGLADCALQDLYGQVAVGDLRLNTRVSKLLWEGHKVAGVELVNGEVLRGEAVVLATNYPSVVRWVEDLPGEVVESDARFGGLSKLTSIPILGVQLWFDRPVVREAGVALVDREELSEDAEKGLQWLFRKDAEGKVVQGVISAAEDFVGVPKAELLARFEKQVVGTCRRKGLEGHGVPKLLRGTIVIEKRATFAPVPGGDAFRPSQGPGENGMQGLYLAGDFTKTDWPATMEGAVRGGYLAAEAVLRDLRRGRRVLVQDLAVEWPARLLGL